MKMQKEIFIMNKNKKLSNQSTNENCVEINFSPLVNDVVGFDFQINFHVFSQKARTILEENGILPRYFEYMARFNILPRLQQPNLNLNQLIWLKKGNDEIPLVCISTKPLNGESIITIPTIIWMSYDEFLEIENMSIEDFVMYVRNIFINELEIITQQ